MQLPFSADINLPLTLRCGTSKILTFSLPTSLVKLLPHNRQGVPAKELVLDWRKSVAITIVRARVENGNSISENISAHPATQTILPMNAKWISDYAREHSVVPLFTLLQSLTFQPKTRSALCSTLLNPPDTSMRSAENSFLFF